MSDEERTDIAPTSGSEELPDLPVGYEYGPGMRRGLDPELFPVAKLLTSFARFSRSLGFYNASNRAVGNFFERVWEEMTGVLQSRGEIDLRITSSAFVYEGEIVYEDTDREHSIPFRLFRDGIRRLHFDRSVTSDELMELAKILGLRLTGVNRHGDDVVTRMWKADFKTIGYAEVKGFVKAGAAAGQTAQDAAIPGIMNRIKAGSAVPAGKRRKRKGGPRKPGAGRQGPAIPLGPDGRPIGVPLDKDGKPIGIPLDADGKPIGIPLDKDGNPIRIELDEDGNPIGFAAERDGKPELFHLAKADDLREEEAEDDDDLFEDMGMGGMPGGELHARWLEGIYPGREDYELQFEGSAVEIGYPELSERDVERLVDELKAEETNVLTRLVDYLLDLSMAEEETFEVDQLTSLVSDGRRYLLSEGLVDELGDLVSFLVDVETSGEYAEVMEDLARDLLSGFYGEDVLQQIVAATPPDGDGPWNLREYLRSLDALVTTDDLLALLRCEMLSVFRRVLLDHLLEMKEVDLYWLSERLRSENNLDVQTAMDALALSTDEEARAILSKTIRHPEIEVRIHLLELLSTYEYDDAARKALIWAMTDNDRDVRIRALEMVIKRKDPRTQPAMMELAEHPDFEGWDRKRREMLLTAIASVGPASAFVWLKKKVKIPRIWGLLSSDQKAWNEHALPALVEIGNDDALELLRRLKETGPAEFRKKALRAYVDIGRRRQLAAARAEEEGA